MASPKIPDLPGTGRDRELVSGDWEQVHKELERVLQSRHFRSCKQGKRFLQYIVDQTLRGNTTLLKERLLGTALFDRAPDYATGEDSVVRVQASDVRRRLEAYRAESTHPSPVIIELPVGSYVPVFRKTQPPEAEADSEVLSIPGVRLVPEAARAAEPAESHTPAPTPRPALSRPSGREWVLLGLLAWVVVACVALAAVALRQKPVGGPTPAEKLSVSFWEPLLAPSSPVVICLGKTVVYRPADGLYRRYARAHPGDFSTDNEKLTRALPLPPTDALHWGDLDAAPNYGFTIGSVRSAIDLAGYLAQQHKAYGVRMGVESSFADLRNFPAVLVGAFNNRWTLESTAGLPFTYSQSSGQPSIQETAHPGRSWSWQRDPAGNVARDYGLITRLTIWKTGQSVISVGGLGDGGTEAATEIVTRPEEMAEVASLLPKGWETKNLQIVVATDITDGEAGRPHVIAYRLW